ncbi:S-layer homology domain-containing protein [Leptolyngbya iicbica]|uniref:S-layer homology domain-containing protein n=2 Tax=Cyanophyceae TaxID=3028117 RepID=A0A4Q7E3I9_9CYAN|nr:S-layer homology domain-containing protein [Leptolyngbya sp. LK]RZM76039.1 S-layer homology domain-containing protein [Leptolyngbya sp. LK]
MNSVATSLMGQSLAVVQTTLGDPLKQQQSADGQTTFYLHGTQFLTGIFPVRLAGLVSVFRQDRCMALRIIFDRQDPQFAGLVYTQDLAQQLFTRIVGSGSSQWRPLETTRTSDQQLHHVVCLGSNLATAWDAAPTDNRLANDIIVYLERRCNGGAAEPMAIASPPLEPQTTTTASRSFSDMAGNPYEVAILKAANTYHLIAGYADGTFRPTQSITREQAVTLLIRAMQQMVTNPQAIALPDTVTTAPFVDVPTTHRSVRQFQYAKQQGILTGDTQNRAYPDAALSRVGLMAMIRKALQVVVLKNTGAATPLSEVVVAIAPAIAYTDIQGHWGAAVIRELTTYGIATPLNEQGTQFAPNANVQRDFAAAALVRMIETAIAEPTPSAPDDVTTPSDHPLHDPNPQPEIEFPDIEGNRYELQIEIAANQYQLVKGFVDGTFRPQSVITREQAVVILLDALRERIVNETVLVVPATVEQPPFLDVPTNRWSAPKLQLAKQIGMVAGNALGYFMPEDPVSRAQLMVMAHQALAYGVWQDFGRRPSLDQIFNTDMVNTYNFVDIPSNHWAAEVMEVTSVLGLAEPPDVNQPTRFAPDAPAQRDYTVATAVRMVQLMYTDMPNPIEANGFRDIEGDRFETEIGQAAHPYQLLTVPADGYFQPQNPVQRATVATMLVNAIAPLISAPGVVNPPDRLTTAPFTDVPADHPAASAIQWVTQVGIMDSDPAPQTFQPEGELTRANLMTIIDRAAQFVATTNYGPGVTLTSVIDTSPLTPQTFTDIGGHEAAAAIARMAQLGIAQPQTANGTEFAPAATCLRNYAVAAMVGLRELPFLP